MGRKHFSKDEMRRRAVFYSPSLKLFYGGKKKPPGPLREARAFYEFECPFAIEGFVRMRLLRARRMSDRNHHDRYERYVESDEPDPQWLRKLERQRIKRA